MNMQSVKERTEVSSLEEGVNGSEISGKYWKLSFLCAAFEMLELQLGMQICRMENVSLLVGGLWS